MEYDYTPRLIKKFINQIEINYKENLVNVDSNKNKETMFLASIIVSAMQIFNREDIKDNIINLIKEYFNPAYIKQSKNDGTYETIIVQYIKNFLLVNNNINITLLKDYINIIFYKQKIPDNKQFIELILEYYKNQKDIEHIVTEIDNYFSIFSLDILLKNLQDGILEIIDDTKIDYITNISKELNESLKRHKINFLESSQNLADKILQYNINKTNENIFYLYIYFINKDKYKNEIKKILNNILNSKEKYKSNVLLYFIQLMNDVYVNNKNINMYDILNDYDFLIDIINNNYLYILFGKYYDLNNNGNLLFIEDRRIYHYINKLNIITKKSIFYILDKNNINNTIKVLLKGIRKGSITDIDDNTDINNVFVENEDIWILLFYDLYVAKKIDKDNSYKLINKGFECILKQEQYILFFIAFDCFYRYREFPIDDDKMKGLNPTNYVDITIMAFYKYKDNTKYDNVNKKILKNIIKNYNEHTLIDLNIEDIINMALNFIYIEFKDENDEYYQYLKTRI